MRGEHVLLYGARGSGKTTLLKKLERDFTTQAVPCGYVVSTTNLDAITRALAIAYPGVDSKELTRRQARARLRLAAEARCGILLLDHVEAVNTQMLGLFRRLRGGAAGALLTADVDTERERRRVREWRLGARSVRMPATSAARLRHALRSGCRTAGVAELAAAWERQILRAARGRIGWVILCVRLIADARYWDGETLHCSVLCSDTEIGLRSPQVASGVIQHSRRPATRARKP